jgi:hypothetical protein
MPLIHCHRRADDRSIFVLHGNDPVPPNHPFSEICPSYTAIAGRMIAAFLFYMVMTRYLRIIRFPKRSAKIVKKWIVRACE